LLSYFPPLHAVGRPLSLTKYSSNLIAGILDLIARDRRRQDVHNDWDSESDKQLKHSFGVKRLNSRFPDSLEPVVVAQTKVERKTCTYQCVTRRCTARWPLRHAVFPD